MYSKKKKKYTCGHTYIHKQVYAVHAFNGTFSPKCIPHPGDSQPPDVRTCRNLEEKSKGRKK